MGIVNPAKDMKPVLQYRWKLMRQPGKAFVKYVGIPFKHAGSKGMIEVDDGTASLIEVCDGQTTLRDLLARQDPGTGGSVGSARSAAALAKLIAAGAIVPANKLAKTPALEARQTCKRCVNDTYLIPDLEFDGEGVCSYCRHYDQLKDGTLAGGAGDDVTDAELLACARNNPARYDAVVPFTGGKDSSFILWYLSKKLGMRVLAATWDMPFMQESARQNVRSAKKRLSNVDFIEFTMRQDHLKTLMRLFQHQMGTPCICLPLFHFLFYPIAFREKAPLFVDGIEKVQVMGRYLPGRQDTRSYTERVLGDVVAGFKAMMAECKKDPGLRESMRPLFAQVDEFVSIVEDPVHKPCLPTIKHLSDTGLCKTWDDMHRTVERELDWKMPEGQAGLLHTSCRIEKLKDYLQLQRYRAAQSATVPQSILEISAAIYYGFITRERGLMELAERGYYEEPACRRLVEEFLDPQQ